MIKNASIAQEFTPIISGSSAGSANVGLYFCNISASPETITLYALPSGEAPSNDNTIIKNLPIHSEDTFYFGEEKFILGEGEIIGASSLVGGRVTATATSIDI